MIGSVGVFKTVKYHVYVISAPNSVDTSFIAGGARYVSYHAGGYDLRNSFISSRHPRFPEILLGSPGEVAIVVVKEVREKEGVVVVEGGGPVISVVGDESQGLYAPSSLDVSDVSKAYLEEGLWGLRRLGFLGELLLRQIVIAEQHPGKHSILDHIAGDEPYGVLVYARDVIGRRVVGLEELVGYVETRVKPRKLSSVFRVIRPFRERMTTSELVDAMKKITRG